MSPLSPSHAAMCRDADDAYDAADRHARRVEREIEYRTEKEATKLRHASDQLRALADQIEAAKDLPALWELHEFVTDGRPEIEALDELLAEGLEAVALRLRKDLD